MIIFRAVGYALGQMLRMARISLEEALDWCPELRHLAAVEVFNGHCDDFAPEVGSSATQFPDSISTDEELPVPWPEPGRAGQGSPPCALATAPPPG